MLYGVSTLSSEMDCKADGQNRNQMAFFRLPLFQTDPISAELDLHPVAAHWDEGRCVVRISSQWLDTRRIIVGRPIDVSADRTPSRRQAADLARSVRGRSLVHCRIEADGQ